jgi:hypothetical protein
MEQNAPTQIQLPPEVAGYIQGLKDTILVQADMIGQRTAEIFGLRAQLVEANKRADAVKKRQRKPESASSKPSSAPHS